MTTNTEALTYDHIVALALEHGFKLKPQVDGRMALNDYVIDFACAVYDIGHAAAKAETAAAVATERERAAQFCDRRQADLLALVPGARRSNVVRMHEACANTAAVLAQAIRAGAKGEPS